MAKNEVVFETIRAKVAEVMDNTENPRQKQQDGTYAGVKELASSIKSQGLLDPPIVVRVTGQPGVKAGINYEIKAGSRRFAAVKDVLEWEYMEVRVVPDATYAALASNTAREGLTTYETSKELDKIQKTTKEDLVVVAKNVGLNGKTAQGYVRCFRELDPRILKEWERGNGLATMPNLRDIVSKNKAHTKQWDHWKILGGGSSEDSQNPGGGNAEPRKPTIKKLAAQAVAAVKAKGGDIPSEDVVGIIEWLASRGEGKVPSYVKKASA
jgi:ParB/RepB/Spo0J family partition protein